MLKKLTVERFFCLIMILFAISCIWNVRGMSFLEDYTLGPAAMPTLTAAFLIFFSVLVWITSTDSTPVSLKIFQSAGAKRGVLMVAMLITLAVAVRYFGFWIPLLVFSSVSFKKIENLPWKKAVPYSVVWTLALYVIFVQLLRVRMIIF